MFGVLLESRARRQRRTGGTALSAALHIAVIGAATAATTHASSAPAPVERVVRVHFDAPKAPPAHTAPRQVAPPSRSALPTLANTRVIEVPTTPSIELPDVTPAAGPLDSIVIGSPGRGSPGTPRGRLDLGDDAPAGGTWSGADLLMRVVTPAAPRYPESLRRAGISGRVLVRFVVDTLGAVDPRSVEILSSTHDAFTSAVREALGRFRFKPSEVHGRRVSSLAEMPFEFAISR